MILKFMERSAKISPCGLYRRELTRTWADDPDLVNFIMLNPSTADGEHDDPTIKKCIRYARRWGFGGLVVTNLFDYRATDPEEMLCAEYPASVSNLYAILSNSLIAGLVVCAWGNHGVYYDKGKEMLRLLIKNEIKPKAFKVNNTGMPAHPLYQKESLQVSDLVTYSSVETWTYHSQKN